MYLEQNANQAKQKTNKQTNKQKTDFRNKSFVSDTNIATDKP